MACSKKVFDNNSNSSKYINIFLVKKFERDSIYIHIYIYEKVVYTRIDGIYFKSIITSCVCVCVK